MRTLLRNAILVSALLLTLPYQSAQSQTVRGIITDGETGEPLSSVTVLYEGTYRGTIANLENDTSIVSISESGTRSFWDREQGHREVQLIRRQTTNIGAD